MNKISKDSEIVRTATHTGCGLRVRESGDGEAPSRTITGYAILFNSLSAPLYEDEEEELREIIDPAAVSRALLDSSDIKMTMFHDRQLILARSNKGAGTLSYSVDTKGVSFSFDAPNTADGDKALELVRRGDLTGCSFMFRTKYYDPDFVERTVKVEKGKAKTTCRVKHILGIYDFTLAADPAYPGTNCEAEARELAASLRAQDETAKKNEIKTREQVREMRCAAAQSIV